MDYLEIEGKAQLKRFNIPTDEPVLITHQTDISALSYPCVVKGQIMAGHRGHHGAVRVVNSAEELEGAIAEIEQIRINGHVMEGIAVTGMADIAEEYYLGLTLDTKKRALVMIFTPFGGTEIEDLAANEPEKLLYLDCTEGFDADAFRAGTVAFELGGKRTDDLVAIAEKLTRAAFELDATTIEINPLVVLGGGELLALDCKLVIDDNALYRQGDYLLLPRTKTDRSLQEEDAAAHDLTYVELDAQGDIGTMAGGAGIGMATVDAIRHYGGRPNNFCDLGGGVTAEKTYHAMRILLQNPETRYVLVNVFGGINNCADMAEGIERAYREFGNGKAVCVKSRGFNQEQGWEIYERLGFAQTKFGTTDEAVKALLALKKEA